MSPEFLRRVKRYQADIADPDVATAQTVQLMARQVNQAAGDPLVKQVAGDAVKQWRGGPLYGLSGRDPWADPLAMAESCWWYAKHHVKFVHHNELIAVWFNERDQLQLLISPEVLVRMRRMEGDCAIYTMLICAMLQALGLTWEIVTAAVDPRQPSIFTHVWPRVVLPDGRRIALDASHGKYAGWQVPSDRIYKVGIWDESGQPVADQQRFTGLHGYIPRGMGDVCNYADADYDAAACEAQSVSSSGGNSVDLSALYPAGSVGTSTTSGTTPSTTATTNWGSLLANLANQWTQIGSKVIAPTTTYVRNADGSVSLVTPGSSSTASTLLTGTGLSGSSLLWVGGGLAALLVVSSMMSKH